MNAQIPALSDLYLLTISAVAESLDLTPALQDLAEQQGTSEIGRLWLMPKSGTRPLAVVSFHFEREGVALGITDCANPQRKHAEAVQYAEGLEPFLANMERFLKQNRIAAKATPMKKAKDVAIAGAR